MQRSNASLVLDITKRGPEPVGGKVVARCGYASSVTVTANITADGAPLDLTGCSAEFRAQLPSGEIATPTRCRIDDPPGGQVSFELPDNIASRPGEVALCYIALTGGADRETTENFAVLAIRGVNATAEEAERYVDYLEQIRGEYEGAMEEARLAEGSRKEAESARAAAENARAEAERSRADEEAKRANAEESRVAADGARAAAETARTTAETARASAESKRVTAETGRVNAEKSRVAAETARVSAAADREVRQAKNDADQALNNEAARNMQPHVCGPGEYDASTLEPSVASPIEGRMYLVPMPSQQAIALADDAHPALMSVAAAAAAGNAYVEWLWLNARWEQVGVSQKQISPISTDEIDSVAAGSAPSGESVLNLTGLSYLWAKIKAAFAPLTHAHAALKGATTSAAGEAGFAPAPAAGAATRYLRSDGTWSVPPDTKYTLPTANASASGGVKLSDSTSSASGVSGGIAATPKAVKAVADDVGELRDSISHSSIMWKMPFTNDTVAISRFGSIVIVSGNVKFNLSGRQDYAPMLESIPNGFRPAHGNAAIVAGNADFSLLVEPSGSVVALGDTGSVYSAIVGAWLAS